MPVILGPDGPSLGGFVCPAVVLHDELWKLGQLRPGDTVRFHRQAGSPASPVLDDRAAQGDRPRRVIRQAGDRYVLIEFGPLTLDLELRMRVQALLHGLKAKQLTGVIDLTPGIRSLQVHFDPALLPRSELLQIIGAVDDALPPVDEMVVPSRTVVLPLSWDDPQTKLAIEKYMQSVRPDAPWCPSNIEFIRRINGLDSIEDVFKIVFDARYLVLGLGDVYLGAPVATPLDPPPGHRRTPWALAAPTFACTAWKARAVTSSSAARCRCGTAGAMARRAPTSNNPGCCASLTRSSSKR